VKSIFIDLLSCPKGGGPIAGLRSSGREIESGTLSCDAGHALPFRRTKR